MRRTIAAAGLAASATLALAASAPAATFESGTCPELPAAVPALRTARCGWLTVPENRTAANGRTIRLPVAILPSRAATPPADPIVYMEGGPGGPGLLNAQTMVDAGVTRTRDVIVVGQRGTAFAQPSLTCPEVDRYNIGSADLAYDAPATGRKMVAAHKACRDPLLKQGIDLGAYNTTENAADFADLRVALGIAEWNVYGVSYGTDLALTYMREHPAGVRSVTIDSVLPPDDGTLGRNWIVAGQGMGNIFAACRAQRSCRAAYPNVRRTFTQVVRALEARPLTMRVKPSVIPGTRAPSGTRAVKTVLDGGGFATWAFGLTEMIGPDLPRLLDGMRRGDRATQRGVIASYAATKAAHLGLFSFGLQNGIVCSEWVPWQSRAGMLADGRRWFPGFPRSVLAQPPQFPFMKEICDIWPVPRAPAAQREVTRGPIPLLSIGGSNDAVTSSQAAESAAAPLEHGFSLTVPGIGHYVVPKSSCARAVMTSFVTDPLSPDLGCARGLRPPRFEIGER